MPLNDDVIAVFKGATAIDRIFQGTNLVFGPPLYSANPVNFDGTNDYLTRGGGLTGAADSKLFTGSIWARRASASGVWETVSMLTNGGINIFYFTDNSFLITAANAAAELILNIGTSVINDTDWHHFMWSVDLVDTGKRHLYVDGVSDLLVFTYTNDTIDFTTADCFVGADEFAGTKMAADVADLQMWDGVYVDLSVAANRRLFIQHGRPVNPATAAASLGSPIILLSDATNTWHTNDGSGGGFTENGALTDGTGPVEI